ncbi:MAG TPA: hypothetical protein VII57_00715 [Dehalococcoidia bacterium]
MIATLARRASPVLSLTAQGVAPAPLQRQATPSAASEQVEDGACACGGGCPRCAGASSLVAKLADRGQFGEPAPDAGVTRPGAPLPYREATELAECIRIMGEANTAYCRQEVLGEKPTVPQRKLTVNVTKLDGSTRSTSVADASAIFRAAADFSIEPGKAETLNRTESEALIGSDLTLDEYSSVGTPTAEETALTARNRSVGTITVYLVKALSAGSHGEAFWPSGFPTVPASVVIKNGDSPFVAGKPLAHELGHVLLDDGSHPAEVTNLMSYSHTGVGLDASRMSKARSSAFVK